MNVQFFITYKRTNNTNNATDYVKLGKKRQERQHVFESFITYTYKRTKNANNATHYCM